MTGIPWTKSKAHHLDPSSRIAQSLALWKLATAGPEKKLRESDAPVPPSSEHTLAPKRPRLTTSGQEQGSRGGGGLRDGDEGHVEAELRGRRRKE